jgi:hypothetical protein
LSQFKLTRRPSLTIRRLADGNLPAGVDLDPADLISGGARGLDGTSQPASKHPRHDRRQITRRDPDKRLTQP